MGDFKSANIWTRLAFVFLTSGYIIELYGISTGIQDLYLDVQVCIIVGYLSFVLAFLLIFCIVFTYELKNSLVALVFFIIFAFIAGIAIIVGIALWGATRNRQCTDGICTGSDLRTYTGLLTCFGALLAILAAIFGILDAARCEPS